MKHIQLRKLSTRAPKGFDKETGKARLAAVLEELSELQNLLYAECKHSVLVVLQGLDASGKDGLIKDVFGAMNPQGVGVHSFKVPTKEELDHDFLWRVHQRAPAKGRIEVFNRSHYEDVLHRYVRLGDGVKSLEPMLEAINGFEDMLVRFGHTVILKFYLHVSEEEQSERLAERMTNPAKMWKYNPNDLTETKLRAKYFSVYEEVFRKCDKPAWHIVPADQNWYKALVVAEALRDALRRLNMQYPTLPEAGEI